VATALQVATAVAREAGDDAEPLVVVTGSVVTVADATRALSGVPLPEAPPGRPMGQPMPG
jgi:folylpolyglutamate synthase/dihydropteroate synthase